MSSAGLAWPNGRSRLWPSPEPKPSCDTTKFCTFNSCDISDPRFRGSRSGVARLGREAEAGVVGLGGGEGVPVPFDRLAGEAGHEPVERRLEPHEEAPLDRRREVGDEVAHPQEAPVRSDEHTSELQSLMRLSYAVFCLKKK